MAQWACFSNLLHICFILIILFVVVIILVEVYIKTITLYSIALALAGWQKFSALLLLAANSRCRNVGRFLGVSQKGFPSAYTMSHGECTYAYKL